MRINFRQGIVSYPTSGSAQAFMAKNGQYVSLQASGTHIDVAFAHRGADYLLTEDTDQPFAWGPITNGVDTWLYWDINLRTGVRTFGTTTVAPAYGATPVSGVEGQHWFDTTNTIQYVYTSGRYQEVVRVFAGKVNTSTFSPLGVGFPSTPYAGSQVGLSNINVAVGHLITDAAGSPIRQSTGTFFTTETDFFVDGSAINPVRLDATVVTGEAVQTMAKYQVVKFSDFGMLSVATYDDLQESAIAMVLDDLESGDVGTVCLQGLIVNPDWNWSTVGAQLWVANDGTLTTTDPHYANSLVYPNPKSAIARVITPTSITFAPTISVPVASSSGSGSGGSSVLASFTTTGITRLSVSPVSPSDPIAVGDNDTRLTDKVAKSGGIMTGPLVLNANPTSNLQAAPRQYVDALTTPLATAVADLTTSKVNRAGDTMTGPLVLNGSPTTNLQAATKGYVDSIAASGSFDIGSLPTIPSFTGSDLMALYRGSTTYKAQTGDFANWLVTYLGLNRSPIGVNQTAGSDDAAVSLSGNILTGSSDPDGDPYFIQSLAYNGTIEDLSNGSFQTTYGVFFLNPDTGDWSFSLGQGARKLNVGQSGVETFTYVLADGRGGLATKTLILTITGTNSVPVVNYFNTSTPVNVTATGNLIFNYAFDYETTPTVLSYTINGISGTKLAGATTTIPSTGDLTINANGDYTFVPVTDFTGAVPLITYTITDGVNNVPAYLTLAVTPLVPGSAPIVLFSDIVSGPITGGENDNGCYLTLWGFRFGTSGGLGTTTKVLIGGVEVANYRELVTDQLAARFPGMQRLTVQVGHIGSPTLGQPLPITVTVSGQTSNADNVFTPNPGNIYFVSLSGDDSTGVAGDITKPFRYLQTLVRTAGGVYPLLRAGDHIVIRGGTWSDLGYNTAWFRFRDPQQQGSNPTGAVGTGWISFMPYPTEDVHYITPTGGNKGGIQGPGQAFSGTCGDWVTVSKLRMEVSGGSTRDAAPLNMQYNSGHWRIIGNNFGPWVAGDSAVLNAACVTGQGNFITIAGNYLHDVDGTSELQNHGIYAGTTSYGWVIMWNWSKNMVGGSHIQFNDSDGGTGTFQTPYGFWQGFTNIKIHNNFLENSAKYGITFSDIGAGQGDLSAQIWNNVITGTGLAPLRLNTTTSTSDVLYAFNTVYNCGHTNSGTGNAILRNEGNQQGPGHKVKAYNNIFAFGPNTVAGTGWFYDASGQSTGYDLQRNLYYPASQTPANSSDPMGVYGDPLFTNTSTLDLSLQVGSPAANAGTKALVELVVNEDYTGQATRAFGGAPDIGAFEIPQVTPYILTLPTVSGGPRVAVATTVSVGGWGNTPTSYSRQFKVAGSSVGSAISGTGTASYTPVGSDSGKVLTCEITATNGSGSTTYIATVGTIVVGVGAPVNTVAPTITGTTQSGSTLTVANGTWTGTVDSYSYQWLRGTTPISGETSSTYVLAGGDIGSTINCTVTANNAATGNVSHNATPTAVITAAAADPVISQAISSSTPANTITPFTFGSDIQGNDWVMGWFVQWDNAPFNSSYADTQGHTGTDTTKSTPYQIDGNNPWSQWVYLKSTATGPYTFSINPQSVNGASGILLDVTSTDPTTLLDIATDLSHGTSTTPALTATAATTKPNDLILIGVTVVGTGHTVTPGSGWTLVGSQDADHSGSWVFSRKISSVETFAFTATIDTSTSWVCQSLVIKGS